MEKKDQWNIGYWIVAGLLLLTLQNYWQAAKTVEPVPYSEFEKALAEGRVAEVLVSDRTVTGRLKSPDSRGKTTIVATRVEPDLAERLSKYDVPYARVVESTWLRDVLSWILPAVAFFGVWFFLFRRFAEKQGMGGFLSIGKSRAKVFMEKNTGVTFADVAGVDEAKAELVEIVDFLKNPEKYRRLGAKPPRGVLLTGEPGAGKEISARYIHAQSPRAREPFVTVPCATIEPEHMEEVLFGRESAERGIEPGLLEQAHGGVIYFDEVADMPLGKGDERAARTRVEHGHMGIQIGKGQAHGLDLDPRAADDLDEQAPAEDAGAQVNTVGKATLDAGQLGFHHVGKNHRVDQDHRQRMNHHPRHAQERVAILGLEFSLDARQDKAPERPYCTQRVVHDLRFCGWQPWLAAHGHQPPAQGGQRAAFYF